MRWCVVMVKNSHLKHTGPFFRITCIKSRYPSHTDSPHALFIMNNSKDRYHLYKAVFFIALFPKAVFIISNVSSLDFLFATQNLIAGRFSRAAILFIRIICLTGFCSTSNDVKIGIVTSQSWPLFRYYSIQKATVTEHLFEH